MTDHDLLVTSGVGPAESRRFVSRLAVRAVLRAAHYHLERGAAIRAYRLDDDGALELLP